MLGLSCVLLLSSCASGPFYYPDTTDYGSPADHGLAFESVIFESGDGTRLHGWFMPAAGEARGTVVHFHGNAQNISAHLPFVAWLPKAGFNVFTFDYRGYGRSEGRPDREGVHADGVAALKYVRARKDVDAARIVVFGQSLGGAVAIAVVAEDGPEHVRGVIVEGAFYSYREIARDKVALAGSSQVSGHALVDSAISDAHSPGPVVHRLAQTPLVILHGENDRIVPVRHARMLHEKVGPSAKLWLIPGGQHLDALTKHGRTYRPRMVRFLKECVGQEEE